MEPWILLHKLRDLGITGRLGLWFFHFLNNRQHYVRRPGGISQPHPVLSGVSQGTVLGPLLFLMIIDIDKGITPSSKLVSFVDDSRVYSCINDINGGKRLHILLSMLFKSMLIHGYNANDLVLSSIISIPKDIRSSLSSSDNYRGISLFNGICKLFDYVIMHTCNDYLYTSDMQFAIAMCSLVYHEIINHYMSNNSNVYSCLLDASKAFDKVHYGKLFNILLNRKVPFCIIRLLMDSFERQMARVMWNSHASDYFFNL